MFVWSLGRSRDLHSEPRAVLQEVLRFHHHYPVIVWKSGGEGAQTHVANGEQVGEKWRSRNPTRHMVVLIPLSFIFSPSSFLRFSLHKWNATLQLQKKKSIIRLHLTSPYFLCYCGGQGCPTCLSRYVLYGICFAYMVVNVRKWLFITSV